MKNTQMKFKLKVKITGYIKALIASILSPVLYKFALYRLTTDNNALRKGWHMPLKIVAERI
jgi:hypothetical protein